MTFTLPNASPQPGDVNQLRMIANGVRELAKGNLVFQSYLKVIPALVTANTTLAGEAVVLCNTTGGNITVTLPDPATANGVLYLIKKADASGHTVTIVGTIDGASNLVLSAAWAKTIIGCDGTQWLILG